MDKYSVQLMNRALQDLDEIYAYIVSELFCADGSRNLIDRIEQAILSLEDTPKRGSVRRTGVFTDRNIDNCLSKTTRLFIASRKKKKGC